MFGQALFQAASGILRDEERRAEMERSMLSLGIRDAGERIWQTVLKSSSNQSPAFSIGWSVDSFLEAEGRHV